MLTSQLNEILEKHARWLRSQVGGQCAKLQCADLRNAKLQCANFWNANLRNAKLQGARVTADEWDIEREAWIVRGLRGPTA